MYLCENQILQIYTSVKYKIYGLTKANTSWMVNLYIGMLTLTFFQNEQHLY